MTDALHRLIDSNAPDKQVYERIAALLEGEKKDLHALTVLFTSVTSDQEKRLRYVERIIFWAAGGLAAIASTTGLTLTIVKLFFTK